VVVIKQLLLPLFVYPSFAVVCSSHIVRRLQQTLDSFLWNGKSPKVPKHILELPVSEGGLAYPNVERMFQSIRLSWTKELFASETDGSWKVLAKNILSSYNDQPSLSENIFKLSLFKSRISASTLSNCYKAWLKGWADLDVVDDRLRPKQAQQIRSEPLIGNRFINNNDGNPIKRPRFLRRSPSTVSIVGDLTYHPAPGILPPEAIIEEHDAQISPEKVAKITRQVPGDWKVILSKPDPPNPKGFVVNSPVDGKPIEISSMKIIGENWWMGFVGASRLRRTRGPPVRRCGIRDGVEKRSANNTPPSCPPTITTTTTKTKKSP